MRLQTPLLLALLGAALRSSACFAQDCPPKEYAEYKDEALTPIGRFGMAFDYCHADAKIKYAETLADLAIRHQQPRDAGAEISVSKECEAEKRKIENALTAAKATKTLIFMHGGCAGKYNIGDK